MRRWLKDVLGRWRAQRIRTKNAKALYRTIMRNQAILENGGTL